MLDVFFIQISTAQFKLINLMNVCFLNSNTITNTIANIESSTIQLKSLAKLNTKKLLTQKDSIYKSFGVISL